MLRIDTHHVVPPSYRKALQQAGIDDAGGRAMPDWSIETALQTIAAASASCQCPPLAASQYFVAGLEAYDGPCDGDRAAFDRSNALTLFPRFKQV